MALAAVFAPLLAVHTLWSADRDVVIVQPDGTTVTGEKWALVIGCKGHDAEHVGPLKVMVADAKRTHKYRVTNAGSEPDHVLLLTDEGLRSATALCRRCAWTTRPSGTRSEPSAGTMIPIGSSSTSWR